MSPPIKGALIAAAIAIAVGILANYGISDTLFGALLCWSPLGALIGWAWAERVKVSQKQLDRYKRTPPPDDPTRYHPD